MVKGIFMEFVIMIRGKCGCFFDALVHWHFIEGLENTS